MEKYVVSFLAEAGFDTHIELDIVEARTPLEALRKSIDAHDNPKVVHWKVAKLELTPKVTWR